MVLTVATVHEIDQFHVIEAERLGFPNPVLVAGIPGHNSSTSLSSSKLKDGNNLLSAFFYIQGCLLFVNFHLKTSF